mmetsp:Transcript_22917/g.41269  ORF Transcript_22917/g.41269 Transcript_22917/m.41269 type:complete len:324 (+) Transcript_22917:150-1121(+)
MDSATAVHRAAAAGTGTRRRPTWGRESNGERGSSVGWTPEPGSVSMGARSTPPGPSISCDQRRGAMWMRSRAGRRTWGRLQHLQRHCLLLNPLRLRQALDNGLPDPGHGNGDGPGVHGPHHLDEALRVLAAEVVLQHVLEGGGAHPDTLVPHTAFSRFSRGLLRRCLRRLALEPVLGLALDQAPGQPPSCLLRETGTLGPGVDNSFGRELAPAELFCLQLTAVVAVGCGCNVGLLRRQGPNGLQVLLQMPHLQGVGVDEEEFAAHAGADGQVARSQLRQDGVDHGEVPRSTIVCDQVGADLMERRVWQRPAGFVEFGQQALHL